MRKYISLFLFCLLAISSAELQAQTKISIKDVLAEITKEYGTKFVYDASVISDKTSVINVRTEKGKPVEEILKRVLYPNNLVFLYVDVNHYAIIKTDGASIPEIAKTNPEPGTVPLGITNSLLTGIVRNENDIPLAGATIVATGSQTSAITNNSGEFSIRAKINEVLTISLVDYATQTVVADSSGAVVAKLKEQGKGLEEVVIVAYGSVNKKDLTGSVSKISGKDLSELPPTINLEQALQGRAAGVAVTQESGQPGAATRVRIRGAASLLGSNQPLYVVDGIPVVVESNIPDNGSAFNNALLQQGLNSPLANINIDDIESISVLKDASATAIYGSRAANGVVIVNTKKGNGKPVYSINSSVTFQKVQTEKVLNAAQFREIWTEAVNNSTSTSAFAQAIRNGSYFGKADINWEDEVEPADPLTTNFNFSVSGGSEKIKYHNSIGIQNQNGSFKNAFFKRYSFLSNITVNASKRITLGTSINLSSAQQGSPDGALLTRLYTFRPDIPVYDSLGNFAFSPYSAFENPVALSNVQNKNVTNLILASAFAEFKILNELVLKSSLAVNYNSGHFSSYYPKYTTTGGFNITTGQGLGFAQESNSSALSHLLEHTLSYNKVFKTKHNVSAVAGASWQGDDTEFLQASGRGFPNDNVLNNLSSASQDFLIGSSKIQSGLISYFGRVNYQYNQKYLLTLSARTDGSSRFAKENKWAFFPTIAGGWRLSEEKFLRNVKFINELKLRASTGVTGSQNFGAYQWLTLFQSSSYGGSTAVIQNQLGNDQLRWELTQQTDFGLDFSLFDSRLNGTVDVYEKNTSDLLYFFKTPGSTGYTSVISNLGSTQNRGFEFAVDAELIRDKNFNWNLGFNAGFNRNKLVKLNDDFLAADGFITPPNTGSRLKVGEPIGLLYGYVADGIFQNKGEVDALNATAGGVYQATGTAAGDIRFRDLNGDGKVTILDQTIIGNANPKMAGGITSSLRYKGFRLSLLFTYSVGNDVRWGTQSSHINFSTAGQENKMVLALNRWTPANPTNQPRAVYLDPNNNGRVSSFYVYDGSYLRMKNLYLSYDFSSKLVSKTKLIKSASLFCSGSNLFTITNYPGPNPETSNLFNDDVSAGLDNSRFPISIVYTMGCKFNF